MIEHFYAKICKSSNVLHEIAVYECSEDLKIKKMRMSLTQLLFLQSTNDYLYACFVVFNMFVVFCHFCLMFFSKEFRGHFDEYWRICEGHFEDILRNVGGLPEKKSRALRIFRGLLDDISKMF